jgi:acyl-CoA reductase-like NAD-dependent aldehyde dehydrogenase
MSRLVTQHDTLFIGGDWVPSTRSGGPGPIQVISPWTEQVIASVPAASRADVDRAVASARTALRTGPWPQMSLADRLAMLRRFGQLLQDSSESLAQLITEEMGGPQ